MIPKPTDDPWTACSRQLAPKLLLDARQWLASPAGCAAGRVEIAVPREDIFLQPIAMQ